MKWHRFTLLLLVLCQICFTSAQESKRPNILVILADDLGFSDLGCYGGEINTPNLDHLAEHGLRFTQFYNTGRCWPTRGALLTGYYAQQIRRDKIEGVNPSGARGKRPAWAVLLPEMLKDYGYRSYHAGKWHMDGMPLDNGFDRSYYLQDQGRFFHPKVHYKDDESLPAVEPGTDFYATTAIADQAISFLEEHERKHPSQPFFQYLAFTAPHFPLHARQEDIARYKDVYHQDWERVRRKRFVRQKKMGIVEDRLSKVERDIGPPYHFPDHLEILGQDEVNRPIAWRELSPSQRRFQSEKMAIHAAMIDRMDVEIGRVIDQLHTMGAMENTLIFFLSDNGASAEIMVRSDGHDPNALPGSAGSYLCLGPSGSTAANTPFRRHKTWVHEGGIATPLIVHWPRGIAARGALRHNPGHVVDLVPTILRVAGAKAPSEIDGLVVPKAPGLCLTPVFLRDRSVNHSYLWWSHEGNRALRMGDWKIVTTADASDWELFHLAKDRTEMKNLAAKLPDKVREMSVFWEAKRDEFKELALRELLD